MSGLMEFLFSGRILLIFGAILLYTASRAAVAALAGGESAPGQRALGHWIPIAGTAVVAVIFRRGDLALSIIFASSVGCLSLLVGSICIVKPSFDAPGEYRRFWPFVLPAALLTLMAGFAGSLSWRQALMFLIEGGALFFAWQELGSKQTVIATDVDVPASEKRQPAALRWAVVGVCILLSIVGAIAGILGAERISQGIPAVSDVATVVAVLGPLLVLPMLLSGAQLAQSDRSWAAITSGVNVVLLNLCVLLPIVILLWYPVQGTPNIGLGNVFHALWSAEPLPFSWVTWRVDNVILIVLAFLLFPASMGRWRMGRPEGLTLIALYAVYVLMEAAGNMRS